jgi:uncharacterized NAD(P)/FAD-binding protein YdhS
MVLERLCSNAGDTPVDITVVDPFPPGPGRVWRTAQSTDLLMNTVAAQVTVYPDATVPLAGRLVPGPSLYEWSLTQPDLAGRLGPNTYPARALYGRYLEWVFATVVATAPAGVTVTVVRATAVRLTTEPDGTQIVYLDNGDRVADQDAVVLAQGHLPLQSTTVEETLAAFADRFGLRYIAPVNPADVDLADIPAGEPVGLRGLGLCFFDYQAMFTLGRGGRFERDGSGTLIYQPSGHEPRLIAGSRRGVPYHARGENQKGPFGRHDPLYLTAPVIERFRARARTIGGLDFKQDLWPMIAMEVESVYYTTLLRATAGAAVADEFLDMFRQCGWGTEVAEKVLERFGIETERRWDWDRISNPLTDLTFAGPEAFAAHLVELLTRDVAEAKAGNVDGPMKAALDVLRDLRNEIRLLIDHGGLTGRSYHEDIEKWYSPLNAYLSIGPPASRIEEMVALMRAGLLEVVGPDVRLLLEGEQFALESEAVPGSRRSMKVLIEARLPEINLQYTADDLLRDLVERGEAAPYRLSNPVGDAYETCGLAVTRRPFRVLDFYGNPHPARFAFGVPTEAVHWVTAAGARPGVASVALGDADAISLAVLAIAREPALGTGADYDAGRERPVAAS